MDFIAEFIDAMRAAGCAPQRTADIVADDRKHRYAVEGDRNGKKNGVFQLKIENEFAVGWFLNFKQGETHKWHSKSNKRLTPEEKAELKKKYDAERRKRDAEIKEQNEKAAKIAVRRWNTCAKQGSTPYLERKQVKLYTARIFGDNVYIPIYDGQQIVNLQRIAPDGTKRFITGGKKAGCYTALATSKDDKSTLVICEGFATGASVREATGYPVIVAFDAGNLKPVAEAIRKKYPDARIIIAADNDQFTQIKGQPFNVGIEKGKIAAGTVGGFIIWPDFPQNDEQKRTDFNDLHCSEGLEAVKIRMGNVGEKVASPSVSDNPQSASFHHSDQDADIPHPSLEDYGNYVPEHLYEQELQGIRDLQAEENWRDLLLMDKNGKVKGSSLRNMILMLQFNPSFRGMFIYDAFSHSILINRCPAWVRHGDFEVQEIDDVIVTRTASELEMFGIAPNTANVVKAIEAVAMENQVHPARDYFDSLEWDGQERLNKWLTYYLGCEDEASDYLAFIGKKWLTAAVRRIYEPGCKFDHILVLEGKQGKGKSTALEALATFGDDAPVSYFTDSVSIRDIGDKDTIMKVQGSIICELAELEGFSKKDDDEIKRWITMKHDDCRLPYARTVRRFPRQFVLAATTNSYEYLKDATGNRRYWPCTVKKIDLDSIKRDRVQLWAEAVHWYKQGLYIGPTPQEMRMAEAEQAKRIYHDVWTDDVLEAIGLRASFRINDIMSEMGLAKKERDGRAQRRISTILRHHGYDNRAEYNPHTRKTERLWRKYELEPIEEEIEI
jgi:putative DNA primase/helicase